MRKLLKQIPDIILLVSFVIIVVVINRSIVLLAAETIDCSEIVLCPRVFC